MNSPDVIDLNFFRLCRKIDSSETEHEFKIGSALLDLYLNNDINIIMSSGEMHFELREANLQLELKL